MREGRDGSLLDPLQASSCRQRLGLSAYKHTDAAATGPACLPVSCRETGAGREAGGTGPLLEEAHLCPSTFTGRGRAPVTRAESTSLPGISLLGVGWGQRVGQIHLEVLKGCSWHCAWGPSPGLLLSAPFQAQDLSAMSNTLFCSHARCSVELLPVPSHSRPCHPQSKVSSQSQGIQETFQGFQAHITPP